MADNQKRDSKGRFKSKPKTGTPMPTAPSVPDRPVEKQSKTGKAKQRIVRLVKNPIYQPVAATKTMEEALQPVKDARTKRKRDKARKQMESTFGDIDWEESGSKNTATDSVEPEKTNSSTSASQLDERFLIATEENGSPQQASLREELIAGSGHSGEVWLRDMNTAIFHFYQDNATLKFIYAEDSFGDNVPEHLQGTDHVIVAGDDGAIKHCAIGEIVFLMND
jgi:hypothetical protein